MNDLPIPPQIMSLLQEHDKGFSTSPPPNEEVIATKPYILIVNEGGSILQCNKKALEKNSAYHNTIIGLSLHTFFHPSCADMNCPLISAWQEGCKFLKQGESHECVIFDTLYNRHLRIEFSPITINASTQINQTPFAIISIENLKDAQHLDDQLALAVAERTLLLEATPHILMRISNKGMILDWSVQLIDEENLPLRLQKGNFIHYIFAVAVLDKILTAINKCVETNEIVKMKFSLPSPHGNFLFDASFLLSTNDEIIMLSRDITEKIRLENIAESVQLMSNIGYIFSGIRHEIGNPINSIKMTMSVLKNNIGTYSQDKVLEYADRVLNEIHRVEYLLTSLRNFNMHENLVLKTLSMSLFLDRLQSLIDEDFKRRGIRIEVNIQTEKDTVLADARALQQVMINILNNAADSFLPSPQNPTITIGLKKHGKHVELSVKDSGIGMSLHQLDNIFKPFFTSKPQGTGLGLVIVKKLMMQMKGDIEIESKPDEGTLVRLILQSVEND
jgi:signal transduction histidine kinase